MTLSEDHEQIVGRGISHIPLGLREAALHYIDSRLRAIREIESTDVRAAVAAAIQRYRTSP